MRVCFLFNHDQIHQVAHSLPIALAMADEGFTGEIIVATTTRALADEVRRLGGPAIGGRIAHMELGPSALTRGAEAMIGRVVPAAKFLIYRDHLAFFRSLDVLVVAEKTSQLLKTRYGLTDLAMVHTRHGAGDRAIGFDRASAGFDLVLCSGPKIRRRLIAVGVDPAALRIVGYPKFDLVDATASPRLLPDQLRGVLYNPHPSPQLSSWYKHGRAVLDTFLDDARDGAIFAPHVMLFQRRLVVTIDPLRIKSPGTLDPRFRDAPNIFVDLGSQASADMTYTLAADVYLGDASSQVYEFLYRPRPCVFLNSHGIAWQGDPNFAHWQAGEVIESPAALPAALDRAEDLHRDRYADAQRALFADSFDLTDTPSSTRAARAIAEFADDRRGAAGR